MYQKYYFISVLLAAGSYCLEIYAVSKASLMSVCECSSFCIIVKYLTTIAYPSLPPSLPTYPPPSSLSPYPPTCFFQILFNLTL